VTIHCSQQLQTETGAEENPQQFPVGRIVSAKPPRKRHPGEIDEPATPRSAADDYEVATERARQAIQCRLRGG
jgi:hypothetical protein